jgi:hypothetical protein
VTHAKAVHLQDSIALHAKACAVYAATLSESASSSSKPVDYDAVHALFEGAAEIRRIYRKLEFEGAAEIRRIYRKLEKETP